MPHNIYYFVRMMKKVKLNLTTAQLRKHNKGLPFQLTHNQLTGSSTGKHVVELDIHENDAKRLLKNIKLKKGFRFKPPGAAVQGGATYWERQKRRAKNTLRKVGNTARDVGKFVAKNVPKSVVKDVANLAIDELELPDETKALVDKGIDYGYATQGKGMKKGSPEAKAWGERMRQARLAKKQGSSTTAAGGSFITLGGSTYWERQRRRAKNTFRKIGKKTLPIAKDIAKDVAKNAVKEAVLGMGHEPGHHANNIHVTGGALVNGVARPLYSERTKKRIQTHGLGAKQKGKDNGLIHGGSFLPLG